MTAAVRSRKEADDEMGWKPTNMNIADSQSMDRCARASNVSYGVILLLCIYDDG
jgi:hypothetical protein